jgi:hypothetical protein
MVTNPKVHKTTTNVASPEAIEPTSAELSTPLPPAETQEALSYQSPVVKPQINEAKLRELGSLLEQDDRLWPRPVDGAEVCWKDGTGRFFVQGAATRLGLILGSMVAVFGITVCSSHPVRDAYVPMAMIGTSGFVISVIERKKQDKY